MCVCVTCRTISNVSRGLNPTLMAPVSSRHSLVQLDDFDAYFKDMSKDSAYKFSLQFEVNVLTGSRCRRWRPLLATQ